jgi:chromosome segregation ATPase
LKDIER